MAGTQDFDIVGLAFAQERVAQLREGEGRGRFIVEAGNDVPLEEALLLRG